MLAADITKEADIRCYEEFKGTDVKGIICIHDALVFEIPGTVEFDLEKSKQKNGVWTDLRYKASLEAQEVANRIVKIMEDVETEFFRELGSSIVGKAEYALCPFWNH